MEEQCYLRIDVLYWFGFTLIGLQDLKELFINFRLLSETVLLTLAQYRVKALAKITAGFCEDTYLDLIHVTDCMIEFDGPTTLEISSTKDTALLGKSVRLIWTRRTWHYWSRHTILSS